MTVSFRVGEPSTGPAHHNYSDGANAVTVTVLREARPQDLRRALAHELAELHSYIVDRATHREGKLHEKSKITDKKELAGHDVGRIAELHVLLHELAYAPISRTAEVRTEIDRLVEHLGFKVESFGKDPRARQLFGDGILDLVYGQGYGKRERLHVELDPKKHISDNSSMITPDTKEWRMTIEVPVKGATALLVYAAAPLEHGLPTAGPSLVIKNTVSKDWVESTVALTEGGVPMKLTEFAIKEAERRFEAAFKHPPQTMSGSLAMDNKMIFQKAYAAEVLRLRAAKQPADPMTIGMRASR